MMKKATKAGITVRVGRFNEEDKEVTLEKGATVQDLLDEAGVSLGSSEELWCNGIKADTEDELQDNDFVSVAGKVDGNL